MEQRIPHQLQQRYKWKQQCKNAKTGTMVMIREENTPSSRWSLGRIIIVIKGSDGLVRVADVRSANEMERRPIHKLASLPIENDQEEKAAKQIMNDIATRPCNNSKSSRKRPRLAFGSTLLTILLCYLIVPAIKSSPVEIRSFKDQPGIYFENLGTANIVSNEWNLIIFYDMNPYWKEYEFSQNCTQTLQDICNKLVEKQLCTGIINHLKHLQTQLSTNHMLLTEEKKSNRAKRGAVNIIGNIANALFGVLDSEYAERMSETIANIHSNEQHLQELIRNQTTILDATLNIMKKEEMSINQQYQQLENHIKQVNERISNVVTEFQQERLSQVFNSISILASFSISNLFQIQTAILEVLADTNHGKISPQLITPPQLQQELVRIKTIIPHSVKLPIPGKQLLNYFKIMTIEGRIVKQHIIFKLVIPLASLEDFEIYEIVPMPVLFNNTFYTLKPSSNFLIVNLFRDQYYHLSAHELQSCTITGKGTHLCKQNHPIFRRSHNSSTCEMDLLNHVSHPSTCKTIQIGNGPHWIQLRTPNQWIYAHRERTTIDVVCGNNVTQYVLEGTGILEVKEKCIIKQPLITIQAHNVYPSNTRLAFTPTTNLTTLMTKRYHNDVELELNNQRPTYTREIEELKNELDQFRKQPSLTFSQHDIHQCTIGYTSIALFVAIFITWQIRGKLHLNRKNKPKPVPVPGDSLDKPIQNPKTDNSHIETDFNTDFNI